MIDRNTTIPSRRSEIFSTAGDNQPAVEVHVLQGERDFANDNTTLGRFHLLGIPPAPRGIPQIEVTFDIDANGIVNVSAKDLGTGTEQSIKIESQTSLSEDEINAKISEAESFAEDDKRRKARVDLRNQADSIVYQTRRMFEESGEKLTEEDKASAIEQLDALEALIMNDDTPIDFDDLDEAAIQAKIGELEQAMHAVSTKLYEAAAAEMAEQQAAEAGDAGDAGDVETGDGVVEADFEVVDGDDES
jgi:molecular chaperone DnaK